ncbi:unnamed protein product [Linum trigynum]|uniref:Cytochrome P450 n=1 Tax=Linum trigynum TaxID=586398 RepID=A0AAV2DTU7_9ROSI
MEQLRELSATSTFLPVLTSTILLLLSISLLIRKVTSSSSPGMLPPPGPWRLPGIGNLHQLVSSLPHQRLRHLARKHGPDVMSLQLGELPHLVVSSSQAAREVMKTRDVIFASRPSLLGADMVMYAGSDLVFTAYTETYKHLRKACVSELLGAGRVKYFCPVREAEMADLVTSLSLKAAAGEAVDLSKEAFWLSTRVTCQTALGKAMELDDGFLKMVENVSDILGGFKVSDLFPSMKFLAVISGYKGKLRKMHSEAESMLDQIINEHKEKRATRSRGSIDSSTARDDLVDVLLNLQESGTLHFNLTTKNIKGALLEVFLAGVETSSTTIDWMMAEMMKDQRVLRKAQEEVRQVYSGKFNVDESSLNELKYLDSVVKESLRLHPPVPLLIPRESREKVEICGYEIPAKTKVIVNAWAIGRDPQYWKESERFYPERFLDCLTDYKGNDFEFIPFGAGRRMCPGMYYASIFIKLTFANLLYHFDWKFTEGTGPENLDMAEIFGLTVRRKSSLCLIPVSRDAMV